MGFSEDEIREMVEAACRRAMFRKPKGNSVFGTYVLQELSLELAEAWARRRGYIQ